MSYYKTREDLHDNKLQQILGQSLFIHHIEDIPGACISDQAGFILTGDDWENMKNEIDEFFECAGQLPEEHNKEIWKKYNSPSSARKPDLKSVKVQKHGFIYLIHCTSTSLYKIGVSQNPEQRKADIQKQSPFELEIMHLIESDDSYGLEEKLHKRFSKKRVNGEWFELNGDDIEWIKEQ